MSTKQGIRYPDVHVQLTGQDGNIFYIMGRVRGALKRAGVSEDVISEFVTELTSSDSYDAALGVVMKWVSTS